MVEIEKVPQKKSVGQNDQLIGKKHTRLRIADENNVNESFVRRAESFANGVDAAEEAVSGIRAKILSGEVKPTAAELAAVSRAAPEERPALVAKLCKPKDEKRAGRKEKKAIVRAKAEKLETEASEPCEPAELPSAPSPELAPQPVKIDNQQLLEIAARPVSRQAPGHRQRYAVRDRGCGGQSETAVGASLPVLSRSSHRP